jgi:5-deoxy-glucuronate isomerase
MGSANHLLIQPKSARDASGVAMDVTRENVGFQFVNFQAIRLAAGATHAGETGENELCIVLMGGRCQVTSSRGRWESVGGRAGVFDGMPHALYLPVNTSFTLTAQTPCEAAFCYCKAEQAYPARLITPADVEVEIRGGGNATRQIHKIITPEFAAHRLLVVEVYTPSGNWSSYPPHKHDVHNPPEEVDLEEIYYYRIDRPEGYAIQRVYTGDRRLDATLTVRDGELVLIPEGYHPVVAAHGYNVYYLNVLAGSARSMAASDDPAYAWVRQTWTGKDPRLPLFQRREAR